MTWFWKSSVSNLSFRPPSRNKSNTYRFIIKLVEPFLLLGTSVLFACAEVAPGTKLRIAARPMDGTKEFSIVTVQSIQQSINM
jgi:hypothetical protein